jgi:transposase
MDAWERMRRGVSQAAAEARKQAAIARLSLEMSGARGKVRRKLQELGEAVLGLYRKGDLAHPSLEVLVQQITALEQQVAALERRVEEMQAGNGKHSAST